MWGGGGASVNFGGLWGPLTTLHFVRKNTYYIHEVLGEGVLSGLFNKIKKAKLVLCGKSDIKQADCSCRGFAEGFVSRKPPQKVLVSNHKSCDSSPP